MQNCATDSTLEHVLGRSGLRRNKVVTLTVINRVVQRGTNINDSGEKGEGAVPLAQALCTRQQVQIHHTQLAQAQSTTYATGAGAMYSTSGAGALCVISAGAMHTQKKKDDGEGNSSN